MYVLKDANFESGIKNTICFDPYTNVFFSALYPQYFPEFCENNFEANHGGILTHNLCIARAHVLVPLDHWVKG